MDNRASKVIEERDRAYALLRGYIMERENRGVWNDKVCPECERLAVRNNPLCLYHSVLALLKEKE